MKLKKRFLYISLFFLVCTFSLWSEVFFLDDGKVLIGTIESKTDTQITIKIHDKKILVDLKRIKRTENEATVLIGSELILVLNDRSIVQGKLVDVDPELGFFVNISVGVLNLPLSIIDEIQVKETWVVYDDSETNISAGFMVLQPLDSKIFGLSYVPRIGLDAKIPGVHGLTIGETIDYYFMTYLISDLVRYRMASVTLNLTVNLVPFFTQKPSFFFLAPYLRLGGGALFVAVVDNRPNAQNTNYGTINAQIRSELGIGFILSSHFVISLDGSLQGVFQQDGMLWSLGGGCSLQYRF